jgi:hypothetical protein
MLKWIRALAGLAAALSMETFVAIVQKALEQPSRDIRLGAVGALSFALVWLMTEV